MAEEEDLRRKLHLDMYELRDLLEQTVKVTCKAQAITIKNLESGLTPEQAANVHFYLQGANDYFLPRALTLRDAISDTFHEHYARNPFKADPGIPGTPLRG